MKTKIRKIGGSKGILLPRAVLDDIGMTKGMAFQVQTRDGSIILTPAKSPLDKLRDYFRNKPGIKEEPLLFCPTPDGPTECDRCDKPVTPENSIITQHEIVYNSKKDHKRVAFCDNCFNSIFG